MQYEKKTKKKKRTELMESHKQNQRIDLSYRKAKRERNLKR